LQSTLATEKCTKAEDVVIKKPTIGFPWLAAKVEWLCPMKKKITLGATILQYWPAKYDTCSL
jgi:hypothetical protein